MPDGEDCYDCFQCNTSFNVNIAGLFTASNQVVHWEIFNLNYGAPLSSLPDCSSFYPGSFPSQADDNSPETLWGYSIEVRYTLGVTYITLVSARSVIPFDPVFANVTFYQHQFSILTPPTARCENVELPLVMPITRVALNFGTGPVFPTPQPPENWGTFGVDENTLATLSCSEA